MAIVRRAFHTRRVGHAGTLDPFATGLLLVLVGQATRLVRYLVGLPKEYHGILRLGSTTATDDATGEVTGVSDDWRSLDDARLRAAMTSLLGEREQVPPAYSAKRVEVHRFDLVDRAGPDLRFEAAVGSGTYLRSLARELGEVLGCGAHLVELRRIAVGPFRVGGAMSLEDVRQGRAVLSAPAEALPHLAAAKVDPAAVERLARGQPIDAVHPDAGPVALLCDGRLVAVAQPRAGKWHPEVVLAG